MLRRGLACLTGIFVACLLAILVPLVMPFLSDFSIGSKVIVDSTKKAVSTSFDVLLLTLNGYCDEQSYRSKLFAKDGASFDGGDCSRPRSGEQNLRKSHLKRVGEEDGRSTVDEGEERVLVLEPEDHVSELRNSREDEMSLPSTNEERPVLRAGAPAAQQLPAEEHLPLLPALLKDTRRRSSAQQASPPSPHTPLLIPPQRTPLRGLRLFRSLVRRVMMRRKVLTNMGVQKSDDIVRIQKTDAVNAALHTGPKLYDEDHAQLKFLTPRCWRRLVIDTILGEFETPDEDAKLKNVKLPTMLDWVTMCGNWKTVFAKTLGVGSPEPNLPIPMDLLSTEIKTLQKSITALVDFKLQGLLQEARKAGGCDPCRKQASFMMIMNADKDSFAGLFPEGPTLNALAKYPDKHPTASLYFFAVLGNFNALCGSLERCIDLLNDWRSDLLPKLIARTTAFSLVTQHVKATTGGEVDEDGQKEG